MRVLVFGAGGYVGREVCRQLVSKDASRAGVTVVKLYGREVCDLRQPLEVVKKVYDIDPDVVINAAGPSYFKQVAQNRDLWRDVTIANDTLIKATSRISATYIYLSSTMMFQQQSPIKAIREYMPAEAKSDIARYQLQAEHAFFQLAQTQYRGVWKAREDRNSRFKYFLIRTPPLLPSSRADLEGSAYGKFMDSLLRLQGIELPSYFAKTHTNPLTVATYATAIKHLVMAGHRVTSGIYHLGSKVEAKTSMSTIVRAFGEETANRDRRHVTTLINFRAREEPLPWCCCQQVDTREWDSLDVYELPSLTEEVQKCAKQMSRSRVPSTSVFAEGLSDSDVASF